MRRARISIAALVVVLVGAVAAIYDLVASRPDAPATPVYIDDIVVKTTEALEPAPAAPTPAAPTLAANVEVPLTIALPTPPAPLEIVAVDSTQPGSAYAVTEWQIVAASAGALDSVMIDGQILPAGNPADIRDDQVVIARGWAGDPALGIRMPYVLLAACNLVFASVSVAGPRPDLVTEVHPNLGDAGWQARLAGSDIPKCDDAVLSAYAVGPVSRVVFPLAGQYPLMRSAAVMPRLDVLRSSALLRPEARSEPTVVMLSIRAHSANLRRCGDERCAVVGALKNGSHQVVVFERTQDWVLLTSAQGAGWVARRLASITLAATP